MNIRFDEDETVAREADNCNGMHPAGRLKWILLPEEGKNKKYKKRSQESGNLLFVVLKRRPSKNITVIRLFDI